jgi:tripartite-type tricarboxylate transporter receptor subunit TctC
MALGAALPQIQEGKLSALAVKGIARSPALPNVPTLREAGLNDAEYPTWFGLFVPAKTPHEIIDRLHEQTLKVLQEAQTQDRLTKLGVDPMTMTPVEFDAFVRREIALNTALVNAIGLKPE